MDVNFQVREALTGPGKLQVLHEAQYFRGQNVGCEPHGQDAVAQAGQAVEVTRTRLRKVGRVG